MKKLTCTICGSTDIFWFEEEILEKRYHINRNGLPSKKPYQIICTGTSGICNFECNNCGAIGDGTGEVGIFEILEVKE